MPTSNSGWVVRRTPAPQRQTAQHSSPNRSVCRRFGHGATNLECEFAVDGIVEIIDPRSPACPSEYNRFPPLDHLVAALGDRERRGRIPHGHAPVGVLSFVDRVVFPLKKSRPAWVAPVGTIVDRGDSDTMRPPVRTIGQTPARAWVSARYCEPLPRPPLPHFRTTAQAEPSHTASAGSARPDGRPRNGWPQRTGVRARRPARQLHLPADLRENRRYAGDAPPGCRRGCGRSTCRSRAWPPRSPRRSRRPVPSPRRRPATRAAPPARARLPGS